MPFSYTQQDNVTIVRVTGELGATSSPELKALLDLRAREVSDPRVIVDLSAVTFIDSSGLGALVAGLKATKLNGGHLALAGLQSQARMIFEITMADKIFDIFANVDEAMPALAD